MKETVVLEMLGLSCQMSASCCFLSGAEKRSGAA